MGPTQAPFPTGALPSVAPGSVRYLAIGASDTVGLGASNPATGSWPAIVFSRFARGTTFTNVGVSGSTVRQAITRQLPQAAAVDPTVVSVWLAVNDLNAGIDATTYARDFTALIDGLLTQTQARIVIANVPDLSGLPAYAAQDRSALLARFAGYNAAIGALGGRGGGRVTVADLFSGSAGIVTGGTIAADGFHPSDAGYQLIADRFIAAMRLAGLPVL